jgi:hypothetical protein
LSWGVQGGAGHRQGHPKILKIEFLLGPFEWVGALEPVWLSLSWRQPSAFKTIGRAAAFMALSEKLRKRLSEPFGEVMPFDMAAEKLEQKKKDDVSRPALLIAVGDQTIYNLLQIDLVPNIGIFDLHCQRKPVDMNLREYILTAASFSGEPVRIRNPAGTVQLDLEKAVGHALQEKKGWIWIEGEDDLAGLTVMAQAPVRTILLYGQPHQGVVWVEIDAKVKKEARDLLEQIRNEK